jgi:hypothetical protein
VPHLRGAETVQDLDPELTPPALVDLGRESLARRRHEPERGEIL